MELVQILFKLEHHRENKLDCVRKRIRLRLASDDALHRNKEFYVGSWGAVALCADLYFCAVLPPACKVLFCDDCFYNIYYIFIYKSETSLTHFLTAGTQDVKMRYCFSVYVNDILNPNLYWESRSGFIHT